VMDASFNVINESTRVNSFFFFSGVDKQGLEFQKKLLCQRQKFLKLGEKN